MTERIQKTLIFLNETYDISEYWKKKPAAKAYRYDHTIRVAKNAQIIGDSENMNTEALVVGALLHDCSYGFDFDITKSPYYSEPCPELEGFSHDDLIWHHGYISALHCMNFVKTLGFDEDIANQILYGIATHIGFPKNDKIIGEPTVLSLSIRDADEIDHVSGFRFYEDLMKFNFPDATQAERQAFVTSKIEKVSHHLQGMYLDLRTETAKKLYKQNLDYRMGVLKNLQELIDESKAELL